MAKPNIDDDNKSWTLQTQLYVRDLWAHKSLGVFRGSFTATSIPPHGVTMIRLSKNSLDGWDSKNSKIKINGQ